jgi:hypothetical protein
VEVISEYHRLLIGASELQVRGELPEEITKAGAAAPNTRNRWGSKEVEITSVTFLDDKGEKTDCIKSGERFRVRMAFHAHSKVNQPVFGIAIYSETGVHITGPNTKKHGVQIDSVEGKGSVEYDVDSLPLLPGTYLFSAAIYDMSGLQAYDHWEQSWKFHVIESETVAERYGLITIPSQWRIQHGDDI